MNSGDKSNDHERERSTNALEGFPAFEPADAAKWFDALTSDDSHRDETDHSAGGLSSEGTFTDRQPISPSRAVCLDDLRYLAFLEQQALARCHDELAAAALALIAAHGEVARVLVTDHSLAGERGAAVLHREQVALNGVLALNQGCTDATVHLIELRDAIDREESRPISSTH